MAVNGMGSKCGSTLTRGGSPPQRSRMDAREERPYVPGEYSLDGASTPQETKSPPLTALYPDVDSFRRVSPASYHDRRHADHEREHLWPRAWLCAGLVRDVTARGSWLRFDVGAQSFLVMRGLDGELRAFHNACQHRGMPLVADHFGQAPRLTCRSTRGLTTRRAVAPMSATRRSSGAAPSKDRSICHPFAVQCGEPSCSSAAIPRHHPSTITSVRFRERSRRTACRTCMS